MSPAKDRRAFEPMSKQIEDSQMAVIIEIFKSISNQVAINNSLVIRFIEDMKIYRAERERKENESQQVNTTQRLEQRVEAALKSRLAFFYWFIDRAAPGIVIAIILAILKRLGLL